jgi:hypothetical protein
MLCACVMYSSTLNMKAVRSFELSVNTASSSRRQYSYATCLKGCSFGAVICAVPPAHCLESPLLRASHDAACILYCSQLNSFFAFSLHCPSLNVKRVKLSLTGRGCPYGCETSMLPHFLENQLTVGGDVGSTGHQAVTYPQEDSWYSFLLEAK